MIIDVAVRDMPFYEDEECGAHVYVSNIYIVNQDQYKDSGSYKKEGNHVFHIEVPKDKNDKRLKVVLTDREICHLKEDLFFVIAEAKGTPRNDTPCGMDESYVIGVTYYAEPLYHRFMHFIHDLERNCEIPKEYIDNFLRQQRLKYEIEAGHYALAAMTWRHFIKGRLEDSIVHNKGCGCHGGLHSR